jgi:two-component system, OmpR family, alkaline phosphatase synthesis response regulator PhoP
VSKILIIDDDVDLVAVEKGVLEREGYHVIIAPNGEDGLKQARKEKPDLIILDITMPVMDGYLFADEFNRDMAIAKIPVVALTSYVESPLDQPVPFEVTEWVNKPIKPGDLILLAGKYLKNVGKQTS